MSRTRLTRMTVLALILLLGARCQSPEPAPSAVEGDSRASRTQQPTPKHEPLAPEATHALHSAELRRIMTQLGQDVPRLWPQEVQQDRLRAWSRRREGYFREIRELADALENASAVITQAAEGQLSGDDREEFAALADKLAAHAAQVRAEAKAQEIKRLEAAMSQLAHTCNECHAKFRAYAGPIDDL